ncbi:GNAT family N-acetyltransferase [Fibrivirga algicola]|uniref:GNAT family N-acetyltransferase n=1 Tax=Fibrivirga algicola TaxID=2950420 RepID=A0ABX0QHA7_9BACT|nr:GNAT family N-acetyltransferase [Fibrivirga algicola]NID11800.1 GNAT family N-acetyltransferase [Fibrivirga algicola]
MIRPATLADLDSLALLFDAYRVFYKKPSALTEGRQFLADRMAGNESRIFVAEEPDSGTLVGFVQVYPLFSSTRMKRLWLLNDLFVQADRRGQGHSLALIDAAKTLCYETGACGLMLETDKTNLIGNCLYPRAGFTLDSNHNFYSWNV